jgi:hypothetical protein
MRAYVITSGVIFALLTVAHILRVVLENRQLATDPAYILLTLATTALAIWAWRVLRRLSQ